MGNIVRFAMKIKGNKEDCEKIFELQHFAEYGTKDEIQTDDNYYLYFDGSCNNNINLNPKTVLSNCDIEVYESDDSEFPYVNHYIYQKGSLLFKDHIKLKEIENIVYEYDEEDDTYWNIDFFNCFILGTSKEKEIKKVEKNAEKKSNVRMYYDDGVQCVDYDGLVIENAFYVKQFYGTAKELEIPNYAKIVLKEVFCFCNTLEKITFPATLEKIDNKAFYKCSNLSEVVFNSKNVEIADDAFDECDLDKLKFYLLAESKVIDYCTAKGINFIVIK